MDGEYQIRVIPALNKSWRDAEKLEAECFILVQGGTRRFAGTLVRIEKRGK